MNGIAYKFGDDINTDLIISGRYKFSIQDPNELAKHVFEDQDPGFYKKLKGRSFFVVAGKNFGCGSSREQAPLAIKFAGGVAVLAKSFARIFYRNAINIGLPIIELKQASKAIKQSDYLEIDLNAGIIKNLTKNKQYKTHAFPQFMQKIINAGGLMKYIRRKNV